jgi:hypothetical protein
VHLDRFAGGAQPPEAPDMPNGIPEYGLDAPIVLLGWAADLTHRQPCAGVYAVVDDVHVFRGRSGIERADVAAFFDQPQLRNTGYEIRIDAGAVGPGEHALRVIALSADGEGRSEGSAAQPFSVRPS